MRHLRKLTLLAIMALAALALGANSASAQGLAISDEINGGACPAVTNTGAEENPLVSQVSGGCRTHAESVEAPVRLTAHIFGVESTQADCHNEFDARIGPGGEGYITGITLTDPPGQPGACTKNTCGTSAGTPQAWEIHAEELGATSGETLEAHFCVENKTGALNPTTCHLLIPVTNISSATHHRAEFNTAVSDNPVERPCEGTEGFRAEVDGQWRTEEVPDGAGRTTIEVTHTI